MTDDALLVDIGEDTGALVVYASAALSGQEIEIVCSGPVKAPRVHPVHNVVRPRRARDHEIHAAVFPDLSAGTYVPCDPAFAERGMITVTGGRVTEIDWR